MAIWNRNKWEKSVSKDPKQLSSTDRRKDIDDDFQTGQPAKQVYL